MAKCCHDMDLINHWMKGERAHSVCASYWVKVGRLSSSTLPIGRTAGQCIVNPIANSKNNDPPITFRPEGDQSDVARPPFPFPSGPQAPGRHVALPRLPCRRQLPVRRQEDLCGQPTDRRGQWEHGMQGMGDGHWLPTPYHEPPAIWMILDLRMHKLAWYEYGMVLDACHMPPYACAPHK
jgi:hypothetical protein